MTSYQAVELFKRQLEDCISSPGFSTKVVLVPSSVREKGLIIQLAVLKSKLQTVPRGVRASRDIRLRVAVCGTAESHTGLEQALDCIEALDSFFADTELRLLDAAGHKIANTRIRQELTADDSFLDTPDSTEVQDVEDIRYVILTIPA